MRALQKHSPVILLAVLVAAGMAVYVSLQATPGREDTSKTSRTPAPVAGQRDRTVPDIDSSISRARTEAAAEDGCLSESMLESHPMFAMDADRLDSVLVSGSPIEPYRGLAHEELSNLAVQDDTAAMVVLGAMSMLRAKGVDERFAVPYLLFEDSARHAFVEPSLQDPEARRQLAIARDWFYKAALHGRLLALQWVGEIDSWLAGGAVGLGWIGKNEFADMKMAERSALMPQNVYNLLAFEIAPQLRGGGMGFVYDLIPKHEYQARILEGLQVQFEQDRLAANLPPVSVPESKLPPWEEILAMLCEQPFEPTE